MKRTIQTLPWVLTTVLIATLTSTLLAGQRPRTDPYAKETLLQVVKLNALPTAEIVAAIRRRGVEFEMTSAVVAEFERAGARAEVVEAIRENYRPNVGIVAASPGAVTPIAKDEIVRRLRARTPPATIERDVEAAGVSFQLTPDLSTEIKRAGGSNSLLGAIGANYRPEAVAKTPLSLTEIQALLAARRSGAQIEQTIEQRGVSFVLDPSTSQQLRTIGATNAVIGAITANYRTIAPAVMTYDSLIDDAQRRIGGLDLDGATAALKSAVELDPSQPTAYSLLGDIYLARNQYDLAGDAMRKAIDRGGNASFRNIMHDHVGGSSSFLKGPLIGGAAAQMFQPYQYCPGSLFVSQTDVTFKANDGKDTFHAETAKVKSSGMNSFHGTGFGAFNIDVAKDRNYNFAPINRDKQVSALIVQLLNDYHVTARKAAEERAKEEEKRRKAAEKETRRQ